MKKEEKTQVIETLVEKLANNANFYLTDISTLTCEKTSTLRRMCFNKKISMHVVKNSLLRKAMEKSTGKDFSEITASALKGSTAILFCESGSEPAKVIKEFRKKNDRPLLKAAYVEETSYIGDNQLEHLSKIKSRLELIGDIIGLLQSPAKNVIGSLQSGNRTLAGIVKTLSEKAA